MYESDAPFVMQATAIAGGAFAAQLEHDCDGNFIAERRGTPAGCIMAARLGSSGHISHLAVLPEYRQFGIAVELVSRAVAHLEACGATDIFCDADRDQLALYESFGFSAAGAIATFRLISSPSFSCEAVQALTEDHIDSATRFDQRVRGDRRDTLRLLLSHGSCGFSLRDKNRTRGYILRSFVANSWRIGPCIADSDDAAATLMTAALHDSERRRAMASVPDCNSFAVQFLAARASGVSRSLLRMHRGPNKDSCAAIYIAGGGTFG